MKSVNKRASAISLLAVCLAILPASLLFAHYSEASISLARQSLDFEQGAAFYQNAEAVFRRILGGELNQNKNEKGGEAYLVSLRTFLTAASAPLRPEYTVSPAEGAVFLHPG